MSDERRILFDLNEAMTTGLTRWFELLDFGCPDTALQIRAIVFVTTGTVEFASKQSNWIELHSNDQQL